MIARIAAAAFLFLGSAGMAMLVCGYLFTHGWDEGVIRWHHLPWDEALILFGSVAFAVAGVVVLALPRKK